MSLSYQTIPPANVPTKANVPKEERSSTPVPRMKKVAIAALFGMALVVVGYSYGASTLHPARMTDIATTTTTTTATATAANLVRGGVQNGDTSFAKMQKEDCYTGPCNKNENEVACLSGTYTKGCHWYPVPGNSVGVCSSCSGDSLHYYEERTADGGTCWTRRTNCVVYATCGNCCNSWSYNGDWIVDGKCK